MQITKIKSEEKILVDIMKTSGIYKIVNKINGKYYVGSSNNILGCRGRWICHKRTLNNHTHHNDYLQRAWNKYGESNFDFTIVENIPESQLILSEQKYLNIAKTEKEKCYNASFVAGRIDMTEEVRHKIGLSAIGHKRNLGRKYNEITFIRRNESRRKNGKPWINDETKKKISEARMGHVNSPESIRQMAEKLKGRKPHNVDKTIYTFNNKITGYSFTGIKSDFIHHYNLFKQPIYDLINGTGRRKSYKGWVIYN